MRLSDCKFPVRFPGDLVDVDKKNTKNTIVRAKIVPFSGDFIKFTPLLNRVALKNLGLQTLHKLL